MRWWGTALGSAVLLSAVVGCSSDIHRTAKVVQWEQQLQLPAVQQVQAIEPQLARQEPVVLDWVDPKRQRPVPAWLFVPAQADRAAPLLVFSHGLGGARERYAYLGRYWASRGFYSLHLQHDGSDRKVWQGSRLFLPFRLMDAAGAEEALARTDDVRFALDQLLKMPLASGIDAQQILIAGHSYGANTAMLLAGAQVEHAGKRQNLRDPRIKAAILISAPPFYNSQSLAEVLAEVTIPTLHITTVDDEIRVPGYYSAPADRSALYAAMGSRHKVLAVFAGGSHNVFSARWRSDDQRALRTVIQAATQTLSAAFVEQVTMQPSVVARTDDALTQWALNHQPVLARFEQSKR